MSWATRPDAKPSSRNFGTKLRDKAPKTVSLCQMMRDELADASHHPFDMAAVDRVLESIPEDGRGNAEFVVGRYLLNRGKADLAGKYLKCCADSLTGADRPELASRCPSHHKDPGGLADPATKTTASLSS